MLSAMISVCFTRTDLKKGLSQAGMILQTLSLSQGGFGIVASQWLLGNEETGQIQQNRLNFSKGG